MVSKIFSVALQGLKAQLIEVEATANKGLRAFNVVGLADTAIKEAKERVGSAVKSIGLKAPQSETKRVLINLAPADIKKEGSLYDLPIALAYLLASEQILFKPEKTIFVGELALDGKLKPIKGALSFALFAKEKGFNQIVVPQENAKEASLANISKSETGLQIIGAESLKELINHLEKRQEITPAKFNLADIIDSPRDFEVDFSWIRGQGHAKRGLEIAAGGAHNLFFQGPPGTGKTLLAKSVVSILPSLDPEELLELTQIYSSAGLLKEGGFLTQRPFRSPHHTASEPALIGGGSPPRPGEITLSHRGVLFLDEFPEFHRDVLESLRQPIESGVIAIQRAKNNLSFPAKFFLIAAANPCPCGYYNAPEKECSCYPSQIASYRRKLSGPLIDRFDIFCWVPSVKYEDLIAPITTETNNETKNRVENARAIQKQRFKNQDILTNSEMRIPEIKKYCQIDSQAENTLKRFVDTGKLSARGYHRVLKVARTIADLDSNEQISFDHLSEALNYRMQEK